MITLKKIYIVIFILYSFILVSQNNVSGNVTNNEKKPLSNVEIYDRNGGLIASTDSYGNFKFLTKKKEITLIFFIEEYDLFEKKILTKTNNNLLITLNRIDKKLNEVVIQSRKRRFFALRQLKKIEGTAIYAGKKTEVVLLDDLLGNKASNNAREIFSQVVGLNIYENDDAGLQLNIGGRGLDPNRTSNFNTRQNGYDISADVLGYPESYYTPPAEALKEIQIIRGAASLQYGTQFGGLLNFKFREPPKNKKFELLSRQSLGSYGLFSSFNSIGGTSDKTGYYGYFNYKKGDGFRPNSNFNSINTYAHINHSFNKKTSLTLEYTYLNYLAKQAGGLTDEMFKNNPLQSNRFRNWFNVNWNLWAVKFKHDFSDDTKFTFNFFGLNASRKALGFRGRYDGTTVNPVTDPDELNLLTNQYETRDLIVGNFKNWGLETRLLSNYVIGKQTHNYLIGLKYYRANNSERQGAGSKNKDANFKFFEKENPSYSNKSNFKFPNQNLALFGENIFNINNKLSLTLGFRLEYIKTESHGNYRKVLRLGNGLPIPNGILNFNDNRTKERFFALFGLGLSYKMNSSVEFYANISQNYRSVTFSDIRTVSPTFIVDENIDDEKGATSDIGVRGKWKNYLSYDFSAFSLFYNKRIGVIIESKGPNKGDRLRTNVGDAFIYGFESFVDANLANIFEIDDNNVSLNTFVNLALTSSRYLTFNVHRKVEFIPEINLKTGVKFGYKNLFTNVQFTHLSEQYTDGTNAKSKNIGIYRKGTIGEIPAYSILDISASYSFKNWKLETGINNALNENYFTRRATGYPGPGIIPSSPRRWFVTLQFKL